MKAIRAGVSCKILMLAPRLRILKQSCEFLSTVASTTPHFDGSSEHSIPLRVTCLALVIDTLGHSIVLIVRTAERNRRYSLIRNDLSLNSLISMRNGELRIGPEGRPHMLVPAFKY